MRVRQFHAKNQYLIENASYNVPVDGAVGKILKPRLGTMFQSYDSNIVFITQGEIYLDMNYWDYSTTTGKYRNLFLGEKKKDTERKIKSGEYVLTDLNS